MDKGVRKILRANDRLTCGKKRTSPLDPILTNLVGGSEGERGTNREKKEKERGFLERETPTSL